MATKWQSRERLRRRAQAQAYANITTHNTNKKRQAIVMVLGDVGRSPRMQYHALSLARFDPQLRVTLLGYAGEQCVPSIYDMPNINVLTFQPRMQRISRTFFVILAPIKVLLQIFQLFWILLFSIGNVEFILLQNPPTIPTFLVVWLCCRLKGSRFVIDWHNFGYSILALSLGSSHALVQVAKWIERVFGQKADANLCVTRAMRDWLKINWSIHATVVHDKPPHFFQGATVEQQHELFQRVGDQLTHCNDLVLWHQNGEINETILTMDLQGKVQHRPDRPAVLISSTSWTADEDFGILLAALVRLNEQTAQLPHSEFPSLLVIVTGKGPQKEMYIKKIKDLSLQRIRIATMWLEASDYPLVLGCADLGVCLHASSSGLDLPMKVLDMFGCGIPVCAFNFKCLSELVHHGKNGLIFDSSEELATQLFDTLKGFPNSNAQFDKLHQGLQHVERWPEHWNKHAAPVFRRMLK